MEQKVQRVELDLIQDFWFDSAQVVGVGSGLTDYLNFFNVSEHDNNDQTS